jgi:hypothetical protein
MQPFLPTRAADVHYAASCLAIFVEYAVSSILESLLPLQLSWPRFFDVGIPSVTLSASRSVVAV